MTAKALVSIIAEDHTGLIAAIAGRLFDLGANLGDTTFAVLGSAAEFTSVCELPDRAAFDAVERDLKGLPLLSGAKVSVAPFTYAAEHGPAAHITHRIEVAGPDSPGLIARLAEVFGEFDANIVRLNSEREAGAQGLRYISRLAVWIPEQRAAACLATVANTAQQMGHTCSSEVAGAS
jgi:glycine cleavage system transcriptional repressor